MPSSKLRGALLTLQRMGPLTLIKEAMRRAFGLEYSYRGVRVRSNAAFRALRGITGRYRFWTKDGMLYVDLGYGIIRVPLEEVEVIGIDTIRDGTHNVYNALNFEDSVVVDIGAYIGDTAIFFAAHGARAVHAYEPVEKFYRILLDNVKLNNLEAKITAYNAGVWYRDATLVVHEALGASFMVSAPSDEEQRKQTSYSRIKAVDLANALKAARESGERVVAKIDCEGCEYSMLAKPCSVLRLAEEYIVEVHGHPNVLVAYMRDCGYKAELLKVSRLCSVDTTSLTLWHFSLE